LRFSDRPRGTSIQEHIDPVALLPDLETAALDVPAKYRITSPTMVCSAPFDTVDVGRPARSKIIQKIAETFRKGEPQ